MSYDLVIEETHICRACTRVYRVRTEVDRDVCPDCERLIRLGLEPDPDERGEEVVS